MYENAHKKLMDVATAMALAVAIAGHLAELQKTPGESNSCRTSSADLSLSVRIDPPLCAILHIHYKAYAKAQLSKSTLSRPKTPLSAAMMVATTTRLGLQISPDLRSTKLSQLPVCGIEKPLCLPFRECLISRVHLIHKATWFLRRQSLH